MTVQSAIPLQIFTYRWLESLAPWIRFSVIGKNTLEFEGIGEDGTIKPRSFKIGMQDEVLLDLMGVREDDDDYIESNKRD